jgi:hypothetical protein
MLVPVFVLILVYIGTSVLYLRGILHSVHCMCQHVVDHTVYHVHLCVAVLPILGMLECVLFCHQIVDIVCICYLFLILTFLLHDFCVKYLILCCCYLIFSFSFSIFLRQSEKRVCFSNKLPVVASSIGYWPCITLISHFFAGLSSSCFVCCVPSFLCVSSHLIGLIFLQPFLSSLLLN